MIRVTGGDEKHTNPWPEWDLNPHS